MHLQARIKELEAVLEEKKATESLLREQLKRLQVRKCCASASRVLSVLF